MSKWLLQMLSLLPVIVTGIEHIHGESKTGAEKKQMAMDALGLSAAVAQTVAPENAAVIAAAQRLASSTIDGVKDVFNAAKGNSSAATSGTAVIAATTQA